MSTTVYGERVVSLNISKSKVCDPSLPVACNTPEKRYIKTELMYHLLYQVDGNLTKLYGVKGH